MQPAATAVAASSKFLIDQILPTRMIHLVSGPSGVGKTTFLLQLLNDWAAGADVLGRKSFPVPFCFMSCARGRDETADIISRCDLSSIPPESLVTLPRDRSLPEDVSIEAALRLAKTRVPGLKLLVLDSIGVLCRGRITEHNIVADFLRKVHDICTHEHLTIIGTGPHGKDAQGEPRSRFLGSVAWGEHASTMVVLEGKEDSQDRIVRVMGAGFAPETHIYELGDDGKFILANDESAGFGGLDMHLGKLQPGEEFETSTAFGWAKTMDLSRATLNRWLSQRLTDGIIERPKKGTYKIKFIA